MKLFYAPASPYARKTRIVAIEKGIELETITVIPYDNPSELLAANPLGAVPTLVTDDGTAIYDSRVICAWLNAQTPEPALIPEGEKRWDVMKAEAHCDGILDACFLMVMERRRPEAEQSSYWTERRTNAINRSLDFVEQNISIYEGDLHLGQITLAAALGYLDFRLSDLEWRNNRPKLDAWFNTFSKRPSMVETNPA